MVGPAVDPASVSARAAAAPATIAADTPAVSTPAPTHTDTCVMGFDVIASREKYWQYSEIGSATGGPTQLALRILMAKTSVSPG